MNNLFQYTKTEGQGWLVEKADREIVMNNTSEQLTEYYATLRRFKYDYPDPGKEMELGKDFEVMINHLDQKEWRAIPITQRTYMNNVPQKIYLQIGDECDADDFNELSTEDITWAADKIFKNDFEYVLASDKDKEIIERLIEDTLKQNKEIERLKGLIEKAFKECYTLGRVHPGNNKNKDYQQFKTENNL